ncbi:MAG: LysR family transcriptional regulator, partial [Pygmaiobacter sp.]
MDNRDFQILIDLYECKNITKVAQQHFISQPAMTKRLQKIEEALGAELLLRSPKGVIFTPVGEAVIPFCRTMIQQSHAMLSTVNQLHGVVGGTINV